MHEIYKKKKNKKGSSKNTGKKAASVVAVAPAKMSGELMGPASVEKSEEVEMLKGDGSPVRVQSSGSGVAGISYETNY